MNPVPPYDPEGPESEWKERLPRPERVARTFAAFANGVGGTLWVGVRDDGHAVGVARPAEVVGELRRIAQTLVVPPLPVTVERRAMGERVLVVARIPRSPTRPVLAPGRDGLLHAFHRDGASTRLAPRGLVRSWTDATPRRPLEPRGRRLLRELAQRNHHDGSGPTLPELARLLRTGRRAARRLVVDLVQRGFVTERPDGRYGLSPEGYRRAKG